MAFIVKKTIVGVDLAKNVIQVCVYSNHKTCSNTEMTSNAFMDWLVNVTPMTIVFEACGTLNFWKQKANSLGHDAHLISPNLVKSARQNQKIDKNDALAVEKVAQIIKKRISKKALFLTRLLFGLSL